MGNGNYGRSTIGGSLSTHRRNSEKSSWGFFSCVSPKSPSLDSFTRYEKSADGVAITMNVPVLWLAQRNVHLPEGRWRTPFLRGFCRVV